MTIVRVGSPYIWATWLSKLLVGENSCEWATWFKAHHQYYAKKPSDFDEAGFKISHTALMTKARLHLEAQGKTVFVEKQNRFLLQGKSGILEGTPDLIGIAETGTICDAKTGQPKTSDIAQVMLYMYAVPRATSKYKGIRFDGLVMYDSHEVPIPADAIDEKFITNLGNLVRRLTSLEPTHRVPSLSECKYCKLTKDDCPDLMEHNPEEEEEIETTDDF